MTIEEIRNQIPILDTNVYGKNLVYLDNAATSQRPQSVIDKWTELNVSANANIHRAVHKLAIDATEEYESARDAVKRFLNAGCREEIIFTSGTTASINLIAFAFGEAFVKKGDVIVVSEAEHHSNIVPWQMMCERKGARLAVVPVDDNGIIDMERLREILKSGAKLACITHISNVLGIINPIKDIVSICHSYGCKVFCDGAQGVVHSSVDVQDLDVDFYAFSGHKIYAATGTGVLYGKKEILEKLPPYMGGGEMIETVKFEHTTYAPLPGKFEAGTQNFSSVPTLKPALEFAESLRDLRIETAYREMTEMVYNALRDDRRIRLFGTPERMADKVGVFAFSVEGVHHEDLALILDKMGVAVRSGQMCAEPLMDRFGVTGMLRASFAPYNTMDEARYFLQSLDRAIEMLR